MKIVLKNMLFVLVICWLSSCCKYDNDQSLPDSSRTKKIHILGPPRYMDYFILSTESNISHKWGIELLSVGDNSAKIKSLKTGQVYSAISNEYFVSQEYGRAGLQLVWISKDKKEIGLYRFSSNPKDIRNGLCIQSNSLSDGK